MNLVDDFIRVPDEASFAMVEELARREGVLCGGSTGANVTAAKIMAKQLGPHSNVVTIAPDGAERYLSKFSFGG